MNTIEKIHAGTKVIVYDSSLPDGQAEGEVVRDYLRSVNGLVEIEYYKYFYKLNGIQNYGGNHQQTSGAYDRKLFNVSQICILENK